jgi:hypothetical protein
MKIELITDQSALEMQRYLRRKRAKLIRAKPRVCWDSRGRRIDGWLIMYLED